jgi:acetyl-CoA C-acetyltransferase
MAAQIVKALMAKVPQVQGSDVQDLMMGIGQPAGEGGFNIGRVVASLAGLGDVPGVTVNRYCSSSLQTIRMAFHAIKAGEGDCFIAAGVEAVSRYAYGASDMAPNPIFKTPGERTKLRAQGGQGTWTPPEGLPDMYIAMGQTAENVATSRGISRARQDEWGVISQNRAEKAIIDGFFAREITPVTTPDGTVVSTDDGPRAGVTLESVATLKPVFRETGTITAGNCCPLNDGAAALVVMSDTRARELGLSPLARVVSTAVTGLSPEIMGMGPVESSRLALARAGMSINDMDLIEINEAFAAQVLASVDDLAIDTDKLNVHGGAIALGHPFGATGARIIHQSLRELKRRNLGTSLVTVCAQGGQGAAVVLERA